MVDARHKAPAARPRSRRASAWALVLIAAIWIAAGSTVFALYTVADVPDQAVQPPVLTPELRDELRRGIEALRVECAALIHEAADRARRAARARDPVSRRARPFRAGVHRTEQPPAAEGRRPVAHDGPSRRSPLHGGR